MYNKLWRKILDSSIWLEDANTRLIWLTLLASMDSDCIARFSTIQNLADRARIPVTATQKAITCLESPDRFKPEQEHEGRRIQRVEDGWFVLRGPEYQEWEKIQQKRELIRKRVERHRQKQVDQDSVTNVTRYSVTRNTGNACNAPSRVTPVVLCSKEEKDLTYFLCEIRKLEWRDKDSVTVEQEFVNQVAKGADPAEIVAKLEQINVWTDEGAYAPRLYEVIKRWQEPKNLWSPPERKSKRKSTSDAIAESERRAIEERSNGES